MKIRSWALAALATAALGTLAHPADAADLALRRVLLSTGGVGYFEYEAKVQGSATLPLGVRIDQIDDVLKSIVVYDDEGSLGEIVLPGKEALSEVFRDLPIDQSALESTEALLEALRGAEVRVQTKDGTFEGRIASVTTEQTKTPTDDTITRHRLAIVSDGTLRQVVLEEVLGITFLDEVLQEQLDTALKALLEQKERGLREIHVRVEGRGERRVRVAYVVAVPLWKATYRLILNRDGGAGTADLQGFAVVENRSGHDWKGVDLTLASGDPVTFRQALYDAYYVDRPEVPVDVLNRVLPRLDEGATEIEARAPAPAPSFAGPNGGLYGVALNGAGKAAPGRAAAEADWAAPPAVPLAELPTAEAVESISQVEYHLPSPVSIDHGQSALLPVIAAAVPAERLSLYQPDIQARHPLAAARLTNATRGDLPPGSMTIHERSGREGALAYLGDARLAPLPAGDDQLAIFAVDQKVMIDREDKSDQVLTLAKIVDGVLHLTQTERRTTVYTIEGAEREPRAVILEHPRVDGFDIVPEAKGEKIEQTATHYRVRREVPAGATVHAKVVLARPMIQSVELDNLSPDQIVAYASSTELPEAIRAALTRVAELQAVVADKQAAVDQLQAERARITTDQDRIRKNLAAVPKDSKLAKGYLATLSKQESRIAELRGEIEAAERAVTKAKQALTTYVRGLAL